MLFPVHAITTESQASHRVLRLEIVPSDGTGAPSTKFLESENFHNGTFNFSETAFRSMDKKPEMFKSGRIDCIYYVRTWDSFECGKCCGKLEEQALVLIVDNFGSYTLQYQRMLDHAENLNCKLYPSHHKVRTVLV
ncbi:hypothetical protein AVEN_240875-1 [Araneus ventricosus]|uniref:Uncharacterized protein n=1 Tax=Araneus ventricosus TaxID=182803 RepID=A0A4Y2S3U8_ARAVE|nr:hypothetical protein AVEN_240875-1 [Araneus ventricosus]